MNRHLIYSIFFFLFGGFIFYLSLPVLRFGYYGIGVLITILLALIATVELIRWQSKKKKMSKGWLIALIASLFYITLLPLFTTWALFRADDYRNLLGTVSIGENFSSVVAPISTEEIRIVDQSVAERLGDKILGAQPALGSQVELGTFNIQKVNDKLYWVAPLLHSGFFKWNRNKEGTPGYVMVASNNERDVQLVQEVNGKPLKLKYQPNSFFGSYLKRHIYLNGYATRGFTDYTFEIDDNGVPYWVVTLYRKEIGFSGENATGIITVNPASGQINEYRIENAPAWIDRIQPEDFVVDQLNGWGEYVQGFWNFANENKLTTTQGVSLVYGDDNQAWWYTGLTSVGSDEGTVGFTLVNTRNKEAIWYKQVGATETAARRSAMGRVQEKGYEASFPITYNINGIPTYVMALKDQAGLVKLISMVSVQDYTLVGIGNTIQESLRDYKSSVNSKGDAIVPGSIVESYAIQSTVNRISTDIRGGNTFYYLLLENPANKIFVGSSLISNELPVTRAGDQIKIAYDDGENEVVDINQFDNLEMKLEKTTRQIEQDEYFAETESVKQTPQ